MVVIRRRPTRRPHGPVVQVEHVDHAKALLDERHVIVRDGVRVALGDEILRVPEVRRLLPYTRHHLRRCRHRVRLLEDVQVRIGDHVPQHAVDRLVVGRRKVVHEILRAEQHVGVRGIEAQAVVLAVHEQQVHADSGGHLLQRVAECDEQSNARRAVVGAEDGIVAIAEDGVAVGHGARVPVRDVQHALRGLRIETSQDVAEGDGVALEGLVLPPLLDHGVGPRLHHGDDPVAGFLRASRARHARPEGDLLARIRKRGVGIECRFRARRQHVARADERQSEDTAESQHPHERKP